MLMKWKIVAALALLLSGPAFAADEPGVSATEIKIAGCFRSADLPHRSVSWATDSSPAFSP
jgi:hypothetical protein